MLTRSCWSIGDGLAAFTRRAWNGECARQLRRRRHRRRASVGDFRKNKDTGARLACSAGFSLLLQRQARPC